MNNKILILANHDVGLYNFRLELIDELMKEGYEVHICLPYGKRVDDLIAIGCKFHNSYLERHGKNPISDYKLFKSYIKIIKEIQPQIVFSYTIKPNIYGAIAANKFRIPFIANITGLGTAIANNGITSNILLLMYRFAFRNVKKVFFQNKNDMDFFEEHRIALGRYGLLPGSGVNLDKFSLVDYPNDKIVRFAFISRIMKEKGIEQYLEAAKSIKKIYNNVEFHVCGLCEEDYEEILRDYDKENIIIYHGMVDDVSGFLENIHCVVHPTYYPEGMSNVLLESCASGRPIITTDRPGCREIVEDGVNGYLIPIKNSSCLINKIEKFLSLSSKDREKMGINARKKVEKEFDRKIVINKYLELLE